MNFRRIKKRWRIRPRSIWTHLVTPPMNCMTPDCGQPPARRGTCSSATTRTTAATSSCATAGFPRAIGKGRGHARRGGVRPFFPQVAHTLGYYWVEYRKDVMGLSNADGFVNERGVVIVSNSMGTSARAWRTRIASGRRRRLQPAPRAGRARPDRPRRRAHPDGADRRMGLRPPAAPTPSPTGTRPSCSSWRAAATIWRARACRTTPSPSCPTTSTCTG